MRHERVGRSDCHSTRDAARRGLDILVVEDEALIAMEIEMVLEEAGHRVTGTASSARDAVEMAGRTRPDLVVMDLRLAGGSRGDVAAREILRRFGIRSLFMSGSLEDASYGGIDALDPVGRLSKPVQPWRLVLAVNAVACAQPSVMAVPVGA